MSGEGESTCQKKARAREERKRKLTTVDSGVLEVDSSRSVGANDDLKLVVESVGAGTDLNT